MRHARRWSTSGLIILCFLVACGEESSLLEVDPTDRGGEQPATPVLNSLARGVEGYATPGELRRGYMYDRVGRPFEITYEVHDGLAVWQGDIILGAADRVASTPDELRLAAPGPLRGVVIDDNSKRWPGGVIPYMIDDASTSVVNEAIDMIEDQTPGVRLIPHTGEANYVVFKNSSGCSSEIGMIGGQQDINLLVDNGFGGCTAGNAAHEILHALGMYHEHTRCNRDNYVTIDYNEIEDGREGNFFKAGAGTELGDCSGAFDVLGTTYDPGSIMHYGPYAFAKSSNPTIIPKPEVDGSNMGQRAALGPTDRATIDALYGANNAAPTISVAALAASYPEGTSVPFDARSSTDADDDDDLLTFAWTFGDGTCPGPAACTDDNPSHPYTDDGVYAWSVMVSDGFDASTSGANITVANVAPTVHAGSDATIGSGETFDFSGTFSDPGVEDDPWGWVIDWGFGTNATGSTDDQSAAIESSIQVCVAGDYTVRLTVTDEDGGADFDELTLTVQSLPVSIDIMPGTDRNPVNITKNGALSVVIFGSPDLDVSDVNPASLTLGDGSGADTPVTLKNKGSSALSFADVNEDGHMDLVVKFDVMSMVKAGDLTQLSTELVLRGSLTDSCTSISAVDSVLPVGA